MPYFTNDRERGFERMMRELPNNGHDPDSPPYNMDCRDCLHYDNRRHRCGENKCVVFNRA
jgi:hypothetical protein